MTLLQDISRTFQVPGTPLSRPPPTRITPLPTLSCPIWAKHTPPSGAHGRTPRSGNAQYCAALTPREDSPPVRNTNAFPGKQRQHLRKTRWTPGLL